MGRAIDFAGASGFLEQTSRFFGVASCCRRRRQSSGYLPLMRIVHHAVFGERVVARSSRARPFFVVIEDDAVRGLRAVQRGGGGSLDDVDRLDFFRSDVVERRLRGAAGARCCVARLPSTRTPST